MAEKKPVTVKRMSVTKSPDVLAGETLIAVILSDTIQEAATKLGITRQMVHERINKYELKDKIANLKEQALIELHMGTTKAARKLITLIDSEDEKVAKAASDSVLDRVGLTKPDNDGDKGGNTFNFINNANFDSKKYIK